MTTTYDVIVIGAGAVGENAAAETARHDLSVAVIENELVGGECTYWACMPSKALLRPGAALEQTVRTPGAAGAVTGTVDVAAAMARRDALAAHWDDSSQVEWLDEHDVTLLRGTGRISGERRVTVTDADGDEVALEAGRAVVVATGSRPRIPDVEGIDKVGVWTSREVTSAKTVPDRLLIIGGGTVGSEMAQAWGWLGSEVTVVHRSGHLLSSEEPFAGDEVRNALERMGVTIHTDAQVESLIRPTADDPIQARIAFGDGKRVSVEIDEVVAATGRDPRTRALGLESVGLPGDEFLTVDDRLQVEGTDWLYAVGDVNGRALLTHHGKYQARILGAHLGGNGNATLTPVDSVPRVIFTSPEVAAVGLTEKAATEKGVQVDVVTRDIGRVAAASILGKGYSGTIKLVLDRERQVIVGATFVGPLVGEILHSATIAIVGEVPLSTLWHAVPSFPTLSEIWLRLLEEYRDQGWDPHG